MPDPSLLTDMDRAAARIADAVVAGETIAVFGDYDVDGATSVALFARFLRHQGRDPILYIPDRIFEGYGPNVEALRKLAAAGARLVIAVDCGSTSFEALAAARELGLDVVVLDHHQLGAEMPAAAALVNPNRQDDLSGLTQLAAVGVAFLAVVAVNRELRRRGWYASRAGAGPARLARPGRARHDLRRGAAHRAEPRLRRQGPAHHGPPGKPGPRRARRRRAVSAARRRPIISASCSGRASMPAGGSATPRSARGCWRATIPPSASVSPPSSTASTRNVRRSRR